MSIVPLVVAPFKYSATVVFLHGFGSVSSDWMNLYQLSLIRERVKWIFPQAPLRPITVANGTMMAAWHDIKQSNHTLRLTQADEDEEGMKETLTMLDELIKKEVEGGIELNRIVVGGFSQGSGMALLKGVVTRGLGGIICLSGYAPLKFKITEMKGNDTNSLPVFWAHGTADSMIKYEVGKGAADLMKDSGMTNITFKTYEGMEHSSTEEELEDLNVWLNDILPVIPAPVSSEGSSEICEDPSGVCANTAKW